MAALLPVTGCQVPPAGPAEPVRLSWRAVTLLAPADAPGRVVRRDLVTCAGRWFLVGGVVGADGGIRPAGGQPGRAVVG